MPALVEIPDYTLLRRIGRGGYGEVWLARALTGEYRALKIVQRGRFEEDRHYQREFRGLQAYSPISRSHPGLIPVYHVGRDDNRGFFYYVMELADDLTGEHAPADPGYTPHTLAAAQTTGQSLPLETTLNTGQTLAGALAHLHDAGLIHRDLKPANIVYLEGQPRLADPGLVTHAGAETSLVGTLGYLPPEGPGHPSADCFALGKLLYEISTGQNHAAFPRLPDIARTPDWPREARRLNQVITTACAIDPAQRYESATDLAEDIRRVNTRQPLRAARARRQKYALAATLALTATGLWFAFATNSISPSPPLPHSPPPKLIAHYPLDGHAQDTVGGNHGQIIGATPAPDRHGNKDGAMRFDGVDDFIRLNKSLPEIKSMTVLAWVKLDSDSFGTLISDVSPSPHNDLLMLVSPSYIGLRADCDGSLLGHTTVPGSLVITYAENIKASATNKTKLSLDEFPSWVSWNAPIEQWFHVTWVMKPNQSLVYLNGTQVGIVNLTSSNAGIKYNRFTIGGWVENGDLRQLFHGFIDELRIFRGALSEKEIHEVMAADNQTR